MSMVFFCLDEQDDSFSLENVTYAPSDVSPSSKNTKQVEIVPTQASDSSCVDMEDAA